MKKTLFPILLIIFLGNSISGKPAPNNTFKFQDKAFESDVPIISEENNQILMKIREIENNKSDNFIVKKFNEYRVKSLKEKYQKNLKE